MDEKEIFASLQFGISRYDHYYDSVNNKGNVYLTLNTFLLAGLLASYYQLTPNPVWWYKASFVLMLISNIAVTISTLWALKPALSKGFSYSRFWFGDVACLNTGDYTISWQRATQAEIVTDLTRQMHALACGLRQKFCWLSRATYCLLFQLALIAIMGFINLK